MKKILSLILSVATIFSMFGIVPTVSAAGTVPFGGYDYSAYPKEFSDYTLEAGDSWDTYWSGDFNVWDNPWKRHIVIQTLLSTDNGKTWEDVVTVEPGQTFLVKYRLAQNTYKTEAIPALELVPILRRSMFTIDQTSGKFLSLMNQESWVGYVDGELAQFVWSGNSAGRPIPKNVPMISLPLNFAHGVRAGEVFDMCQFAVTANANIKDGEYTITTDVWGGVVGFDNFDFITQNDGYSEPGWGITCATVIVGDGSSDSSGGESDSSSTQTTGQENTTSKKSGWQKVGGTWYYYTNGNTVKGWLKDTDGKWYYMNSNGAMVTGWVKDSGTWYFMRSSGEMATGWVKDGGSWYYMNSSGAMQTGWVKDGNTWYYMDNSGVMQTGWKLISGKWYYMDASGAMLANQWVQTSGKWYYVTSDGAMAVNTVIGGYRVDANGVWVK